MIPKLPVFMGSPRAGKLFTLYGYMHQPRGKSYFVCMLGSRGLKVNAIGMGRARLQVKTNGRGMPMKKVHEVFFTSSGKLVYIPCVTDDENELLKSHVHPLGTEPEQKKRTR